MTIYLVGRDVGLLDIDNVEAYQRVHIALEIRDKAKLGAIEEILQGRRTQAPLWMMKGSSISQKSIGADMTRPDLTYRKPLKSRNLDRLGVKLSPTFFALRVLQP